MLNPDLELRISKCNSHFVINMWNALLANTNTHGYPVNLKFALIEGEEYPDDDSGFVDFDDEQFTVVLDPRMPTGMIVELMKHELAHVDSWFPEQLEDHDDNFGMSYARMYCTFLNAYEECLDFSEIWAPVLGYEGVYEVSSMGRLKRLQHEIGPARGETKRLLTERISTGSIDPKTGYVSCNLKSKTKRMHALVCEAFLGKVEGCYACHNDGDRANNTLSNVRWDTPSGNQDDRRRHGTYCGKRVVRSDGVIYQSASDAARDIGSRTGAVSRVARGELKTHKGFGFKYEEN